MQIDLFGYRMRCDFAFRKLIKAEGIISPTENGNHILLWDFDHMPLKDITRALHKQQKVWNLPTIYIIESSPENYHAYCFYQFDFATASHILLSTDNVDLDFVTLGIVRKYWTLRISLKSKTNPFKLIGKIESSQPENISLMDVVRLSTVKYITELGVKQNG